MNHVVLFELDQNRKRLEFYQGQKARIEAERAAAPATKTKGSKGASAAASVDKWIEIYHERVKKLERQVMKLGLKTQLAPAGKAPAQARA
jgi:hypothetical protein